MFGPIAAVISLPVRFKFLMNADILKPRENMEVFLTFQLNQKFSKL
jgi:hypothetical protein